MGRIIRELERLYGITHGNNQHGHEKKSSPVKSQLDLACEMGIDVRTLQNYKQLANMIPALDDLVTTGTVTKTTALTMIKELSPENKKNYRCC